LDVDIFEVDTLIPLGEDPENVTLTGVRYETITRRLVEIADLDNLLGYRGNYMIFPAREANILHVYMMQPYIDTATEGLKDLDGAGEETTNALLNYICLLRETDPCKFKEKSAELKARLQAVMTSPRRSSDLVVIPTDSLYIEALPGTHPVMEDFKMIHRALDVKKVQAEVRRAEVENLRLAARLLSGEREDPDVERKIVISAGADDGHVIVPPEA
jgi:hypothetical protein